MTIDATLYLPEAAAPAPAVLLAHGFGGSKADLDEDARLLAQEGYVALAYSARGFGASGGLVHVDAPDFEVADARKLLDLLASRPEVLKDGPGDPRVGVVGGSYGGALALLLAGTTAASTRSHRRSPGTTCARPSSRSSRPRRRPPPRRPRRRPAS